MVFLVRTKSKKKKTKSKIQLSNRQSNTIESKADAIIMSHSTANKDKEHTGNTSFVQKIFNRIMAESFPLLHRFRFSRAGETPHPSRQQPLLDALKKKRCLFSSTSLFTEDDKNKDNNPPLSPPLEELPRPKRRKQMPKAREWMTHQQITDGNGNRVKKLSPRDTPWFVSHVLSPNLENKNFHVRFRNRFRMQHHSFLTLLGWVKQSDDFAKWTSAKTVANVSASPVELLLLGSLRYLGRGWTFDDLEESTAISREVHRCFFHVFIKWGSDHLFNRFVKAPSHSEDPTDSFKEFETAGMPGCIGSTDACHVGMLNCPSQLSLHNSGFKMNMPTRTFNLTANHRRRILSTTSGHPGRWNDKTLVRFDEFVTSVKDGRVLPNNVFTLLSLDKDGMVVEESFSGVWLIVDNGCLRWSVTVPPHKHCRTCPEKRWSKWVEGIRKDVECTFGILKGRFRVLKNGIRVSGPGNTDRIWMTCCALHNFLLEEDNLHSPWEHAVGPEIWLDPNFSNHSDEDLRRRFHMARVTDAHRSLDTTSVGRNVMQGGRSDQLVDEEVANGTCAGGNNGGTGSVPGCTAVNSITLDQFRSKLIQHFDILFNQNKVKWPSRRGIGDEPTVSIPATWRHAS